MEKNVGNAERVIRVIAGLAILSLLIVFETSERWWGLVGLVPLVTGLMGWCLPYTIFGINTRNAPEQPTSNYN